MSKDEYLIPISSLVECLTQDVDHATGAGVGVVF
jgi:hypothetical protein